MDWMTPTRKILQTAVFMGALALAACGGSSGSDATDSTSAPSGTSVSTSGSTSSTSSTAASSTATASVPDPLLFSSAGYSISQSAGSVALTVLRVGSADAAVSVDYSTVDGTAIAGNDYTATSGTLQWAAGDSSSKTIVVQVSSATLFTGNKSFTVALTDPSATAQIASPDTAVVIISGNAVNSAGSLQFSATAYAVAQSSNQVIVTVTRTTASSGVTSVNYATSSGTAVAGSDFTAASGTLTWADGDASSKTFLIPIADTPPFSGSKSFAVSLSDPASGAILGSPATSTVTISGSETAFAGTLHLSAATYAITQGTGALTVTVNRTGGTNGDISVNYATASGTAEAGRDFTSTSGTLTWASGDSTAKTFICPISSATPFSGSKSFTISLSSPGNGATISSPSKATVTIAGDASSAVGAVQFGASSYSVAQTADKVSITVNRTDGSTGAVGVAYATTGGTAKAGTNFTSTQGVLSWADGDASAKTFTVAIGSSAPFSGSKTFSVALSQTTGGVDLGSPNTVNVNITGTAVGSVDGSGSPSAPQSLVMTRQGGNSISLAWNAATAGDNPVAYYKIYRNGSSYDTSSSTTYTDSGATNATDGAFTAAATIYRYTVSAVDTAGNEGPQTTQTTFNAYANGVFNWSGDYSYGVSANYKDTDGGPESGAFDIAINVFQSYGGFQPYAGNVVPQWDLETGSFGYVSIDLKPTSNNQSWRLSMISRLPPGDVYPWAGVNVTSYGPTPVAGKWATYKIPLSALSMGKTSFQGYISGNTLTVTSVSSGVGVDAGGFISGDGVKPGTYITGHNANGGPGTYTVSPSQNVGSVSMTEQRTGLYKFDLIDESGASSNRYYIDNVKFTTQ